MRARLGRSATAWLLLTVAPIFVGIVYAAAAAFGLAGPGAGSFSAERLARTLGSAETWRSLAWTIAVAGAATIASVGAAVWSAEALSRSPLGRRLALLPLAVPHAAAALGVLLLLGQSGVLARVLVALGAIHQPNQFPSLVYDARGIGLFAAFCWKEFPFLALAALAVRAGIPDSLQEVTRGLGGDQAAVERAVMRPLVSRGLLPAALAVFAYLLGQYEMASILGPSTPPPFAVLAYERGSDPVLAQRGDAYVLALLAMGIAVSLVWVYGRVASGPPEQGS